MIKRVFDKLKRPKTVPDLNVDDLVTDANTSSKETGINSKNPVFTDEFKLLVTKGRVIDYSHAKNSYNVNVDIGIYNDTYQYLTEDLDEATAKLNVFKVLSSVGHYFEIMIHRMYDKIAKEKQLDENYKPPSQRTQKLFRVHELELPNGGFEGIFCLNLLTRPDALFVVIGLKPKGKLRTQLGDKDKVTIWQK